MPRTFRGREGVKLGGVLEERGTASAATPKLRELPSPLPGLPNFPGPQASGVEALPGVGGRAGPPSECCWPGPDGRGAAGGGGIWNSPGGPNVVTMASAGWTGSRANRSAAPPPQARGGRQWGPRGGVGGTAPPGAGSPLCPPPAARGSGASLPDRGCWGRGEEVRVDATSGRGRAESSFLEGAGAVRAMAQCGENGVVLSYPTVLIVPIDDSWQTHSPPWATVSVS